jgi:RsiW-degrading membrane proteinase PrsW (M82 family)
MLTFLINTIASVLLGFFWLRFFRHADGFEKESWKASLICLSLGLLSPLVTFAIDPFMEGTFDRNQLDGLLGFAVFQVGAVEEFSKILPFLIIMARTNWINESVDYVKYPAVSAIGFATTENILYAMEHGVDVLQFRAVLSLPGHVFFSSVCGYFLYRGIREFQKFSLPHFLAGFSIGVLAHGLYDFFLFTETFLGMISIVMAGFFAYYIKKMLFISLRDSEYFNADLLPEIFKAGRHLYLGMVVLFFLITISAGINSGNWQDSIDYAFSNGIPALITTAIMMALIGLDEKGYRKVLGIPSKN